LAEFNLDFSTRQATIILRQIPHHVQGIRLTSGTGMRRTKSKRCDVAYMHASLSPSFLLGLFRYLQQNNVSNAQGRIQNKRERGQEGVWGRKSLVDPGQSPGRGSGRRSPPRSQRVFFCIL